MTLHFLHSSYNLLLSFILASSFSPSPIQCHSRPPPHHHPEPPQTHTPFIIAQIWESVPKPPAHKNTPLSDFFNVMVATFRCEEIVNERCSNFTHNPDWRHLEEASQSGLFPDFGRKLSSILGSCFSEYNAEALYFDEGVRTSKRKHLEDKLLQSLKVLSVMSAIRLDDEFGHIYQCLIYALLQDSTS